MAELLRYCQIAQSEGLSMRAALKLFRGAGGSIRTDAFAQTWRAAKASNVLSVGRGARRQAA